MTLTITILPIILIMLYLYNKDNNKEPKSLLLKLFLSGVLSIIITLFITTILGFFIPYIYVENINELTNIELLFHAFIGVALIEEFSKWIMTYKISFNNIEFDEIYDIIIYSVFVSLGFATLENILYVSEGGLRTAIIRALLSVPGHACFGIFMGHYFGLAKTSEIKKEETLKNKYLLLSILVPTILHGIYDYCLFRQKLSFLLIFLIFICLLYKNANKRIKLSSSTTKIINYKNNYCPNCGTKVTSNFCPTCGRKNERIL